MTLMAPEHQWYPPEFPDVTLLQPVQFDRELAGELQSMDPRQPVWATTEFEGVGLLYLKYFAAAASEMAYWSNRPGRAASRTSSSSAPR